MKKITFVLCAFLISLVSFSQPVMTSMEVSTPVNGGAFEESSSSYSLLNNDYLNSVFITHSNTQDLTSAVSCNDGASTYATSLYRQFDLANSFDISGDFLVTSVEFATFFFNGTGPVTATVNLYSTSGSLPGATLDLVATTQVVVASSNNFNIRSIPINAFIPAGQKLIYEIALPTSTSPPNRPAILGNVAGATGTQWFKSADCGAPNIVDLGGTFQAVMNVRGAELTGEIDACAIDTPRPLGPGPANGVAVSANNVPVPGVIGEGPSEYVIDEVLLNIQHSWASDLQIVLVSPSGTQVRLARGRGGSSGLTEPRDIVFRDDSPNMITSWTGGAPLANYKAEGGSTSFPIPFGNGPGVELNTVFDGEPVNGNWEVRIFDAVNGDGGTLNSFCIDFIQNPSTVGTFPQIVCPLDITVNSSSFPGEPCGAQVFFNNAQAFDLEDGLLPVVQTMGPPTGSIFPIGETIIEFSTTDSDGNTSTCQFTVTVIDDVPPVAVCQDITVELDATGTVTIFADQLDFGSGTPDPATPINCSGNPGPTSPADTNLLNFSIVGENFTEIDFDNNCPGVTGLQDQTALSVDLIPGETYTVNASSWSCGASQWTAQTYVWIDFNNDGELTSDEVVLTGAQAFVSGGGPTGASPTGGTPFSNTFTVPADAAPGSVIIRAMTQETSVTPLDPCASFTWGSMIDFTANIVVGGQGSSDACGPVTFSFDPDGLVTSMVLDCSNLGENTITLYVTDGGGNVVSCESIVTVEDNIAPVIVCNNAGGLQIISEDFEAGVPAGWSAVTNSGPCDWQVGQLPWAAYQTGSQAMYFDDDACGSGAAPSNATVFSDVYNTAGATTLELSYDVAFRSIGTSSLTVEVYDGASWQNVATYSTDTPTTSAGPFDLLAYANADFQVRFTYDDGGSWAWGAAFDNFLLEFETPAGTIPQYFLDINGEVTVPITDLYSMVSDNCSVVVSAGGASGGTPEVLPLGFAGGNGNFGTFFDVNALNDITINSFDANMQAGAPVDVQVYYKSGTWVGFQTDPGAWTLIGEAPGTVPNGSGNPTPLNLDLGQVINAGETGAFYVTAQVLNGGFSYTNGTGVGNVWAEDANLQMLEGGAVAGFFTGTLFQPRVFNGNIHYTAGGGTTGDLTFTCADLGIVNVTVTATDSSGNTTSCVAQIEIIDNIAPVVVGEDITVELGPDGTVCIEPEDLLGILPPTFNVITISSDNGSGAEGWTDLVVDVTEDVTVSFDWSYTTQDGAAWDQFGYLIDGVFTQLTDNSGPNNQTGNTTVPLTAGQEFGFRARSDDGFFGPATITVSNFMPGFSGQFDPANWTEVLTNSDGSATFVEIAPGSSSAFDNCGITVTAIDISCFTCADIGNPVLVTIFVSDASGNIASSTATVTVVDLLGPVIDCPADMTVDTDPDSITYTLPDYFGEGLATATDNCTDPVIITGQSPAPGTLLLDGTYTITLTAEDEYGNESECTFELTVETILGDDDNVLADAIVMYPNPAEAYVSIRNNSLIALTEATIYDINGRLVSNFDLSQMSGDQRLDISNLASGVYMVYIQSENASVVKRLIKK